jgi:aqualysin 1
MELRPEGGRRNSSMVLGRHGASGLDCRGNTSRMACAPAVRVHSSLETRSIGSIPLPSLLVRLLSGGPMKPHLSRSIILGATLFAFGCVDEPTAPGDRSVPPQATVNAGGQEAGTPIPDRYIVLFRKDVKDAPGLARKLANVPGGKLHFTYQYAVKGFAATLPPQAVAALESNPNVLLVEQDQIAAIVTIQSNATWGLDRIDQRARPLSTTYEYNQTGAGVRSYIIDTGILTSHSQFGGRASAGYDALGGNGQDCNGHGTHVAGTVGGSTYGVAKSTSLIAVRVLDCSGSGSNSGVIAGVDWVRNNHIKPAVANMSLGGGASSALDNAVTNAINAGVPFAVAAGNENVNACNSSPARAASALTVGSTTSTDARSSFSNYGSCLDIFAPGSSITSAWYTSTTATNTISGTSMASPHVAGVAALYLQTNPSASAATVNSAIINSATTGVVTSAGTGSPNRLLYSLFGAAPPPPPPSGTCTVGTKYTGTLSGAGDYDNHPNGTYYYSAVSGTHKGCLSGPSGTDFDLYLYRWSGSSWTRVAASYGSTSVENISYSGTAGYYYWEVESYSGSGSYEFWLLKP